MTMLMMLMVPELNSGSHVTYRIHAILPNKGSISPCIHLVNLREFWHNKLGIRTKESPIVKKNLVWYK